MAGRAVGQQLPKWSGKQYPCAELRAEQQHQSTSTSSPISSLSVRPSVGRSVVRSFGRCVGSDLIASTITTSLPVRKREKMCVCACVVYPPRLYSPSYTREIAIHKLVEEAAMRRPHRRHHHRRSSPNPPSVSRSRIHASSMQFLHTRFIFLPSFLP